MMMMKETRKALPKVIVPPVEKIVVLKPDFEEIQLKNKRLIEEAKSRRASYKRRYHIGI